MRHLISAVREHNTRIEDLIYRLRVISQQSIGLTTKETAPDAPPNSMPDDMPMVVQLEQLLSGANIRLDQIGGLITQLENGLGIDMGPAKSPVSGGRY